MNFEFAPRTLLIALAFAGSAALAACADDMSSPGPVVSASDGTDIATEKEGIAGEELELSAGSCPKGYDLTLTKKGNLADLNQNGWVCNSPGGDVVDDTADQGAGVCPDGFEMKSTKPGGPGDLNANGWVCTNGEVVIDDELVSEDRLSVNGHGNFVSGGKKGEQDISFSFHAKPIGDELDGKGQFEFHDQLHGLDVHGSVECVATQGTGAFIAAVVTKSTDPSLPVGILVGWFAQDNGEPGDGVDGVTRPSPLKKKPGGSTCSGAKIPAMSMAVIVGGNIQVH
jgi:hypothetical protein